MDIKDVDVAVIYTDGSHLTTPPGTGAGIHGYLFNHGVLDDRMAYRYNGATEHVTVSGYKKFPQDIKVPDVPDTVEFVDAFIPLPSHFWSDAAELTAFITLFESAPFRAKNYIVYVDASYLVNTWNQWIENWKRKNWTKADGGPIGNRELIIKISEIKDRMHAEGRSVKVIKIKGHAGHYGNERADQMAGKASALVAAGVGVEHRPYWSTEEMPEELIIVEEEQALTAGVTNFPLLTNTVKFCFPMVNEPHPEVTVNGESWKYMFGGNHAKNKDDVVFVGKMIPDAQFAVFFNRDGWDNIYTLVNNHCDRAWDGVARLKQFDPMAIVYLDFIKRKKFVDAAKGGLPISEMPLSDDRNVCMFQDLLITRLLRPALLSYRALTIRDELASWLRDAIEGRKDVVLNDITDLLFDAAGKPRKDFYRAVDRSFSAKVGYAGSDKTIPVVLTRGTDLPARSEMNRIKEPTGRYYVATRRTQARCVEYAVVYIGEQHHGLWCGYYANKRILQEAEAC